MVSLQRDAAEVTYFARVLGADGDAKLRADEGVVDEFGHVRKRLAVVLTGGQSPEKKSHRIS